MQRWQSINNAMDYQTKILNNLQRDVLGIESHFVGVHGPYELHRKEKQIKCTALAVHENLLFSFRCNSYGPWTPTKCDSILIFTSFNNKVCWNIAYFNTKMSYLSDFKRTNRATDKARKSVITHWKSLKTHWKYKLGVKIRISILRYALGVQCSAYWLSIHVLKQNCRCQSVRLSTYCQNMVNIYSSVKITSNSKSLPKL